MTVECLLERLEGVRKTGTRSWCAICPAHEDRHPSLTITESPGGIILIHDFAGCSAFEVLKAVGMEFSDLFPEQGHDDMDRPTDWRAANYRGSRRQPVALAPRTALIAIAHDVTEAAVIVSDVAEGQISAESVRLCLWTLAGRIASALNLSGCNRG